MGNRARGSGVAEFNDMRPELQVSDIERPANTGVINPALAHAIASENAGSWNCPDCGVTWARIEGKRYFRVVKEKSVYSCVCPECVQDDLDVLDENSRNPVSQADLIAASKLRDEEDELWGEPSGNGLVIDKKDTIKSRHPGGECERYQKS